MNCVMKNVQKVYFSYLVLYKNKGKIGTNAGNISRYVPHKELEVEQDLDPELGEELEEELEEHGVGKVDLGRVVVGRYI